MTMHALIKAGGLYNIALVIFHLLFWKLFRETPAEHPWSNDAEDRLVSGRETGKPPPVPGRIKARFPPILPLIKSVPMWLMCLLQYGINIGWVFLVTWLPTYLQDVKGVDPKIGGLMSTFILFVSYDRL